MKKILILVKNKLDYEFRFEEVVIIIIIDKKLWVSLFMKKYIKMFL